MLHDLDLWLADCREQDSQCCRLVLNAAELARAQQYKHDKLRQRFIITRAILKQILARYQDIKAEDIYFERGQYGKLFLSGQREGEGLVFNVSHSANRLAVVIGTEQRLGVDIEQHKSTVSLSGLVKKCFSESESQFWRGLPESEQLETFFDIWTVKESFVKATGRGIALGLNQCVTSAENLEQLVSIPDLYGLAKHWRIIRLTLAEGYSGAICTNDLHCRLNIYSWLGRRALAAIKIG